MTARNKYGLTKRQDDFAVAYATRGLSASDAYRQAYSCGKSTDAAIWVSASRLLANPKVQLRIEGLLEQLDLHQILKVGKQTRDTIKHRDMAVVAGNWTAAASYDRQLNEMFKALVSRVEISDHRDPEKLIDSLAQGDAEVEAALRKIIGSASGFTKQ
jgi:hypothetical protein